MTGLGIAWRAGQRKPSENGSSGSGATMFADDIINSRALRDIELGAAGHDQLSLLLRHAQKFVLAPDFVSAADALYVDKPQLHKTVEFCRLPFRLCWFEFSNQRRTNWVGEAKPNENPLAVSQTNVERMGFLFQTVEGTDDWMVSMFWKIKGLDVPSFTPYAVTVEKEKRNAAFLSTPGAVLPNAIPAHFEHFAHSCIYGNPNKQFARMLHRSWNDDWDGELPFIFAMLGILNARNIAEREYVDRSEMNRKRERRGKSPLSSHHTLTINSRVRRFFAEKKEGGDAVSELRAHFVRGHFKVRKSGVFFWSPFLRGDQSKGFVSKDYKAA